MWCNFECILFVLWNFFWLFWYLMVWFVNDGLLCCYCVCIGKLEMWWLYWLVDLIDFSSIFLWSDLVMRFFLMMMVRVRWLILLGFVLIVWCYWNWLWLIFIIVSILVCWSLVYRLVICMRFVVRCREVCFGCIIRNDGLIFLCIYLSVRCCVLRVVGLFILILLLGMLLF